ncbi:MAG: hypothetical protein IPJ07_06430 [Acidobacteria bacterium]|nr:hypothetical protein [Acidobacteriota bacterium]
MISIAPGSILRIELDASSPLSFSMDQETIAWFEGSPAFEIVGPAKVKVIARYPGRDNPLLSGWISGDRTVGGKAAMVEAAIGKGRVIVRSASGRSLGYRASQPTLCCLIRYLWCRPITLFFI